MKPKPHNRMDLLQRFLPTPFIFSGGAETRAHIESNDLEIALAIRSACRSSTCDTVANWTVFRDYKARTSSDEVTLIADETLRTLLIGQGTILVFDRGQRSVLGFIHCGIDMQHMMTVLVPQLLAG